MAMLSVWAPQASLVELESHGQRTQMQKQDEGFWQLTLPWIQHGDEYAYYLDGQGPFPDPTSAWQPRGVEAPSGWHDHSQFTWDDHGWQPPVLESGLIYELHIGTFTPQGTFQAAIQRLDYLKQLGVTHLELMPVAEFSGKRGWGYDGAALYAPHHAYGGPDGLKQLVNAAHAHGLAVILDVVYNHLGPIGNFLGQFGPYFTDRYKTPWGQAVNFDGPDSDKVRQFFINNALQWLKEYHLDGLRLDATHAIYDRSAWHFLEQLATQVHALEEQLGRRLLLIAESDLNDPRLIRPQAQGGYGLDALWNEDFHHALHAVLTKETQGYYQDFGQLAHLAKALTQGLVYQGNYSRYRRSLNGRPVGQLSGQQLIGCLQNHDQVGNRQRGERIGQLVSIERTLIGAAILMTAPFIPLIFQGEEWAASTPFLYFTDHQDPKLGQAVYQGRQKEFAAMNPSAATTTPDPQALDTFMQSKLHWEEPAKFPHSQVLAWYQSLIQLRRQHLELQDGNLNNCRVSFDEERQWLTLQRGALMLACNLSTKAQSIPMQEGRWQRLLASRDGSSIHHAQLILPQESVTIVFKNGQ